MANRRKPEFSLTADLEKFKYEVAEEISINNKKHRGLTGNLTTNSTTNEK